MSKNTKNKSESNKPEVETPEVTALDTPSDTEVDNVETNDIVETPTESEVTAPVTNKPNVTVTGNMPKSVGIRNTNSEHDSKSTYVTQLTSVTNAFVEVANDKSHSVETFNRSKIAMANALSAAIKYPDGNEFVSSMNAFLSLVKEHRSTAFHESIFNQYVPWLDMTHSRTLELTRVMTVFQQLASSESKNISKAVDFNVVFTSTRDERIVGRFRNWAVRQA